MDSKDTHAVPPMVLHSQTMIPPPHLYHHHHPPPPIHHFPPSDPSISTSSLPLHHGPPPFPVDGGGPPAGAIQQHPYGGPRYSQNHQLHYQQPQNVNMNPPPAGYSNPAASYGSLDQKNIKTLFISGLPDDVKPREIHNLFRIRPGFENCQLKYTGRGNQVVAFATFSNHQAAMSVLNELNGAIFDPDTGAKLHIELARSNSRSKRPKGTEAYWIIDKRVKEANDTHETGSNDGDGGSDEPSSTDNPSSSIKGVLAATESGETAGGVDSAQAVLNEQSEKPVGGEIPPCSTLFIANLGPSCTEEELKQVLSQYNGFHMLKMRSKGGMPVAFADFQEVQYATEAMKSLQGSLLPSSDRGGLHMEYARSKMRKS